MKPRYVLEGVSIFGAVITFPVTGFFDAEGKETESLAEAKALTYMAHGGFCSTDRTDLVRPLH